MHASYFVAVLLAAFVTVAAAEDRASIVIENRSTWTLHHVYLSPSNLAEWGADQLGRHVIVPNDTFTITNIHCPRYDMKVVDEDGDVCVIRSFPLCGGEYRLRVDDGSLLACEAGW